MCGICGFISSKNIDINKMNATIIHRGPDAQGEFKDGDLSLGHTRLSILDLSIDSNQPMISRDKRFVIVYNGEVYNFLELKNDLKIMGVEFFKSSDTEVILEGFAQIGIDIFEKLNGMFAFAIYDKLMQKVYIARDRFGIKPLYYYFNGNDFIFGSEIKALLASNIIKKTLNYQALYEYLHFATTLGENSFYKGIKKLEPGHYIEFDIKKRDFQIKKYKLNYEVEPTSSSFEEAVVKTKELFEKAVQRQLISDVPVGVFLSGGIDSTAITAFATKHYNGKVKTFSAGFDFDNGENELDKARFISKHFGTEHHEIDIKGANSIDVIEELNYYYDQPFGDAANIPLYLMSKELKGKQKVILQGDGGDELFAGYHRYLRLYHYNKYKAIARLFPIFKASIPKSSSKYKGLRFLYALYQKDRSKEMAYILSQEMFDEDPADIFSKDVTNRLKKYNPFSRYEYFFNKFKDLDKANAMLYTDTNIILPDLYFEKVDRATMANSIEVRVPFLDNNLSYYAMSLPKHYKIRGKDKKYLLKRAFDGIVPKEILYGPKMGFGVPFQFWLRDSMKDYMIDSIKSSPIYNQNIEKVMREHISGLKDNGYILWKLLNLAIWMRRANISL